MCVGRAVVSVSKRTNVSSRSRLDLVSRKTVNVSVSGGRRLGLGHSRLVPKTNFGQIVQATVRSVSAL